MGNIVHTSKIRIVREKGPTRRAMIEGFSEPIYYGVHGGIKPQIASVRQSDLGHQS